MYSDENLIFTYGNADVFLINNQNITEHKHAIYPHELETKETTKFDRSATYMDICLSFDDKEHLNSSGYDTIGNLNYHIHVTNSNF